MPTSWERFPLSQRERAGVMENASPGRWLQNFLNQRKHFFTSFCLIGFRIFSLILLTDFYFCRQFSKSNLLLFLVLIWSKKSIWYQMRYQILPPFLRRILDGMPGRFLSRGSSSCFARRGQFAGSYVENALAHFSFYNLTGSVAYTTTCILIGYFLGRSENNSKLGWGQRRFT